MIQAASSAYGDPVFWGMVGAIISAAALIGATIRSIVNYFKKNRVDRLQMYTALVDDLQDELKRLRYDMKEERKEYGARLRDMALLIERQIMEIEALKNPKEGNS